MLHKIITISVSILLIIILGIGCFLYSTSEPNFFTVMRSIPQGDLLNDERTPEEACLELLANLQPTEYKNYSCSLSSSERIDNEDDYTKCTDGVSAAGCFSCILECSK